MSVEALLAIFGLIVAVLALVPADRATDIRLRFGTGFWFTAGCAGLVLVYWSLREPIHSLPVVRNLPRPVLWLGAWDPASSSTALILLVAIVGFASYARPLGVRRLSLLESALTNSIAQRRYSEAIHLLNSHLPTIRIAQRGDYFGHRAHRRLISADGSFRVAARTGLARLVLSVDKRIFSNEEASDATRSAFLLRSLIAMSRRLEDVMRRPSDAAHGIIRLVSRSPQLVEEIATVDPNLGLRFVQLESSWVKADFAEAFAAALVRDPSSALYHELRATEQLGERGWPSVDPREQPLLSLLCQDAVAPEGPNLLYTFLEACVAGIGSAHDKQLKKQLRGPMNDYFERSKWTSPPFAFVRLLEVVMPRLANIRHLSGGFFNAYVADQLAGELLKLTRNRESDTSPLEWPSRAHYLLYELVSSLAEVARLARSSEVLTQNPKDSSDGWPFVSHAIEVLNALIARCMRSKGITDRYRGYLLEIWWRTYAEKHRAPDALSSIMLDTLAEESGSGSDSRLEDGISAALHKIDPVLRFSKAADDLRNRFGISDEET